MAAGIGNAYLNAPCREKIYTVAGPEFGTEEGTTLLLSVHCMTKPDGFRYYEMILMLKEDSLGPPSCYLGTAIKVYTDRDGVECWAMFSDEYVKIAVAELKRDLEKESCKLKGKASCRYDIHYHPEIDISQELDNDGIPKYQGYMGVFCWMVELGQIDMLTEASHLASHQALPCEG
eukprot:4603399-Ditylum_brightwellii.AAC.1